MSNRESGTVKWFNDIKGYGYIRRVQGDDIYVHFSSIRGEGYRALEENQNVSFTLTNSRKGLQAQDVCVE